MNNKRIMTKKTNHYANLRNEALSQEHRQLLDSAMKQSGILNDLNLYPHTKFAWLNDRTVKAALSLLIGLEGDKTRKYGKDENGVPILELTHPLWCAHQAANTPLLLQDNHSPEGLALSLLLHDYIEDHPDHLRGQAQHNLEQLLLGHPERDLILDDIHYMTDPVGIPKERRLQEQKKKSFKDRRCIISARQQTARALDKLDQLRTNQAIIAQMHADPACPNADIETLKKYHKQAEDRAFILHFPHIDPLIKEKYAIKKSFLQQRVRNAKTAQAQAATMRIRKHHL